VYRSQLSDSSCCGSIEKNTHDIGSWTNLPPIPTQPRDDCEDSGSRSPSCTNVICKSRHCIGLRASPWVVQTSKSLLAPAQLGRCTRQHPASSRLKGQQQQPWSYCIRQRTDACITVRRRAAQYTLAGHNLSSQLSSSFQCLSEER
jgi:hypothetical protein